ncbi:hypothetical protein ACIP5Y_12845 [Nocardia sp. NPDC088792]|uniref:hypothetical protein n=1 Tax=Nocardia sp. NPDC088792 TaxID=3364332 RepID=UPI003819A4D1
MTQIAEAADRTTVTVRITIDGPLGWFWTKVLGGDLAKSVGADLNALVAAAEGARA